MRLKAITIGIVPEPRPHRIGVIGLPTWMWAEKPGDHNWDPITRTASARGSTVRATAALRPRGLDDEGTEPRSSAGSGALSTPTSTLRQGLQEPSADLSDLGLTRMPPRCMEFRGICYEPPAPFSVRNSAFRCTVCCPLQNLRPDLRRVEFAAFFWMSFATMCECAYRKQYMKLVGYWRI